MPNAIKTTAVLLSVLLLSACASVPNGPSLMVLPGSHKNFDQFRYDDGICRQYALDQIGGTTANQAADSSLAKSAVVGTALGAALGAAAGGGRGAGIGAATGLLFGSLLGAEKGSQSAYGTQGRYDNAYVQCMYARGHKVPVSGHISEQPQKSAPAPYNYPPPPPPPGYRPDE